MKIGKGTFFTKNFKDNSGVAKFSKNSGFGFVKKIGIKQGQVFEDLGITTLLSN